MLQSFNDEVERIGDNFVYNPDILALGCSITVPIGIPHGLSWPHLIKDELNESVNVMADGGSSVQRITYNATHHMLKYGIPKKIYFLIPSLDRAWIASKNNPKNYPRPNLDDLKNENYYQLQNQVWRHDTNEYESSRGSFVSKDFLNIKRSISLEYGLQNQILSLVSFFSFCKLLGIDCFYYSWDAYFDNIFSKISLMQDLANYVKYEDNNHSCWWQQVEIDFDSSYFSSNIEHKKYWEIGLDIVLPGTYEKIKDVQMLVLEPTTGAKRFNMSFETTFNVEYKIDENGKIITGKPANEKEAFKSDELSTPEQNKSR